MATPATANTTAATEARMRKVDQRYAERLTARGWTVTPPAGKDAQPGGRDDV